MHMPLSQTPALPKHRHGLARPQGCGRASEEHKRVGRSSRQQPTAAGNSLCRLRASLSTSKLWSLFCLCPSAQHSQIVTQEIMQMILPISLFPTVELGLGDAKLQNSTAHSRRFSAALSLGKQAASMAPPRPEGGAVAVVRHALGVGERGKSY